MTPAEKKRLVAKALIYQAGSLVEFWSDMTSNLLEPEEAEEISPEFARECLNTWLKNLPGDSWDTRLGPVD